MGFEEAEVEPEEPLEGAGALVGVDAGADFAAGAGFDEAGGVDEADAEEESAESLFFDLLDFFLVDVSDEAALSADCDSSASADFFVDFFFFVEVSAELSA